VAHIKEVGVAHDAGLVWEGWPEAMSGMRRGEMGRRVEKSVVDGRGVVGAFNDAGA
jgi:hypothetical protein